MPRHDSNANRFQLEPLEARLLFSGDTIYVAPIGDSITYGTAALYQAGYRGPLEDLLQSAGQGHVFTGTLDNLPHGNYSGLDSRGHFAIPGGDTVDLHNSLTTNYGQGASTFDALRSQGTSPDFVLVHLGTNNFDYGLTSDDATAAAELDNLLAYMHGPEGIDAGTQIMLARIIPRAYGSATWDAADKAALLNIAQYNYNQLPALDAAYGNSIVPVDMFRIDATTLTTLTAQEMAMVNTDGDAYVDWIVNFDESDPLNQSNINATTGRNTALFNDSEHPTALGYKIMAEVWSKALLAASQPPPTGQPISVGDLGKGLFGKDNATGTGYILYSQQNVHDRFDHPWLSNTSYTPDLAQNLIVVKLIDGTWHIDGNVGDYQAFTPTSTDVLIAAIDFDNDTVTDLKGTDSNIAGITAGYAQGDLTFVADQWDDQANNGEFQVYGTYFQLTEDTDPDPDPDPTPQPISVGDLGKGLFGKDNATGTGYILYSQQNVHDRFDHPWLSNTSYTPDLAQNLIIVKFINGTWHIDGNVGDYQAFTPTSTDVLIAAIDFDNDTVTDLKGTDGTVAGITAGYAQGDLTFVADQWDDQANNGEFQVYGSTFTRNA